MPEDEDAVVGLAKMQVQETLPHLAPDFCEETTRQTFRRAIKHADPTIFVIEENREVIAFLMVLIYPYAFLRGHFVGQEVIYVRPDKRGTRASARLFDHYDEWADRLKAREAFTGVANGRKVDKFAKMMARRGYELVGMSFRRIIG